MPLIAAVVIVVLGLTFIWSSIRILREYERGVVFTLGRYTGTKGPGFFLLVIAMLLRSRKRPIVTGKEALAGAQGEAVAWEGEEGRVLVQGEVWRARAAAPLAAGARVKVIARDGLVLVVEKA